DLPPRRTAAPSPSTVLAGSPTSSPSWSPPRCPTSTSCRRWPADDRHDHAPHPPRRVRPEDVPPLLRDLHRPRDPPAGGGRHPRGGLLPPVADRRPLPRGARPRPGTGDLPLPRAPGEPLLVRPAGGGDRGADDRRAPRRAALRTRGRGT